MRILWLKTELLHPVDKGGRIRTYAMLRELRQRHEVTYLTLDDGTAAPDAAARATEYCDELEAIPFVARRKGTPGFYAELAANLASSLPYFLSKYRSPAMRRAIERRLREGAADVLVCDFLNPAVNLPATVPIGTVLFEHNVEAQIWRRHWEVERRMVRRWFLRDQWRKARRAEAALCRRFDTVVAVSPQDREMLRASYGLGNVEDVQTGVDTSYFKPSGSIADPNRIVFTGSMDWLPNIDAMRFFIGEVVPQLRRRTEKVAVSVVGRNPTTELIQLAATQPGIEVTGRVPDVRPYMERASVFVVPIRVGSGTRLKIYEAMAMERPVVSTTVGCEGLPVVDGEHLLIADTAESFAEAVHTLMTDAALAKRIATNAAALVRREFDWSAVTRRFEDICARAASARGG